MTATLHIETLPERALDAASEFSTRWLPQIRSLLAQGEHLVIVLPEAGYDHADWRRAMVRDLAREYAPARVCLIGGGCAQSVAATLAYLNNAPGVTGQYLPLQPVSSGGN